MNRILRSLLAGAFAATGAVILTPGCADNNSSLFITGVLYRQPPTCIVIPSLISVMLGGGVLDLAFSHSYVAALLVGNQMSARGSKTTLRSETSRVTLRGAEVNLTDSAGNSLYTFSVNGTGFVDVSRGEDAALGIFDAELIPAPIGDQLQTKLDALKASTGSTSQQTSDLVVAHVRVFGSTLGNRDITSSELSFPITYCEGCLIDYPLDALRNSTANPGELICNNNPDSAAIPGCSVGQDDPVDCRRCFSTNPLCVSPGTSVTTTTPDGGAP